MNAFEVKDYSNIDNGAQNIVDTANAMTTNLEDASRSLQAIYNDSSFYGPIADHCAQALEIINRATKNNLDSFVNNANSMGKIKEGYIETDQKVEENVGGV